MKSTYLAILIIMTVSCNMSQQTPNENNDLIANDSNSDNTPDTSISNNTSLDGCFIKILQRDTAILSIQQNGNDISGKMFYDNFQKDGSRGTVKGKEEDGIIKLWYDFYAEGTHSVAEVYFKKDKGRLLRGVGDIAVKGDTAYFTSGINYSLKEDFNPVDCELVKWKLNW